jgi:hypothetical protein
MRTIVARIGPLTRFDQATADAFLGIMDALLPHGVKYDPDTGEVCHEGAPGLYKLSAPPTVLAVIALGAARWGVRVERTVDGYSVDDGAYLHIHGANGGVAQRNTVSSWLADQ